MNSSSRSWRTVGVTVLTALVLSVTGIGAANASTAHTTTHPISTTQVIRLTPSEAQQIRRYEERQSSVVPMVANGKQVISLGTAGDKRHGAEPALSYGITGDHFWIIASYYDVASGAIWVAQKYCDTKLPDWICSAGAALLKKLASGWGWATNHGVWAALYWSPPKVTGGRW